ncbi:MAG TPA: zinc ribbon domain-containing protein [Solirubrobacterales bacterium]|nr:zinc ribbon domain-containing protein [Solirubrobacterales bacterium]
MPDPVRFGESLLRFDGLYRRGGALSDGAPITSFLRFAADGTVQNAGMRGEVHSGRDGETELKRRPAAERVEGPFEIDGTALSFETKSSNGIVEYQGAIEADGSLVLDSHSHINGHREEGMRFEFVEIEKGPRRLSEMIPRCVKLDCRKLRSGSVYEHGCGIRTTSSGWPLPAEEETVLGRWNVIGSRFFIDMKEDPQYGAYITEGSLGILVTDKSLKGSFYEGKGPVGKLAIARDVLSFYWPYSLMAEPGASHYQDDRRMHIVIEDPEHDGHLGLQGITQAKGAKADDFLGRVFSVKNRAPEFHEQVGRAWEQFRTGEGASDRQRPATGEPTQEAGKTHPPTAVDTNIGSTRFFDLSTVADTATTNPTEPKCASCGEAVDMEDRFCASCGQDLAAHSDLVSGFDPEC